MLHIAIPVHNEAPTIGVLLWRIRKVFREFPREFQIIVYNDGSTDATAEILQPYGNVLPLTILGTKEHRGYAAAVDALVRHVARHAKYARRDAMILMQGDFTDPPEHLLELVKRFEGGADVVIAERPIDLTAPQPVQRLRRFAPWVLRPFLKVPGVTDPFSTLRLMRVAVAKDLVRAAGEQPIVQSTGWATNVDLLISCAPHTKRIETLTLAPRWDLRPRTTRVQPWEDLKTLFRFARTVKKRPPVAVRVATPPAPNAPSAPSAPTAAA